MENNAFRKIQSLFYHEHSSNTEQILSTFTEQILKKTFILTKPIK